MPYPNNLLDISNSNKIILIIDPVNGELIDVSDAAVTFYGWTKSELLNMSIFEINTLPQCELRVEMSTLHLKEHPYLNFRHIVKSGKIKKVHVTSLTLTLEGRNVLLHIVDDFESPSEALHIDIQNIFDNAFEPLVLFRVDPETNNHVAVEWNRSAADFFGGNFSKHFLSNHISVYDQSVVETALKQMTSMYYYESNILFNNTRSNTVLRNIGFTRLFYESEYFVCMQVRPSELPEFKLIKENVLPNRLNRLILDTMNKYPLNGYLGILCLSEADELLHTLGKETYMKILLTVGKSIKSQLGEGGLYELLDESVLFFNSGAAVDEDKIQHALKILSNRYRTKYKIQKFKIQCVAVAYNGETFNPEYGLAYKMLATLNNNLVYTKLNVLTEADARRIRLINDLSTATTSGQLYLLYQPIVDITKGSIASLEALVRWKHPEFGIVEPDEFIRLAEENNMVTLIDEWVLNEVTHIARKYPIHVNLSAQDFWDDRFRDRILKILSLESNDIVMELTETSNVELSNEIIVALASVNAKLSIDDFGTGYSSMSRIASMNVGSIKIDKSFVANSSSDIESASLCIEMIRLGRGLNIDVIAEGAETMEQIRFLHRNGCHLIQGYAISKPLVYEEAINLDVHAFKMNPRDKYGFDFLNGISRVDFSAVMAIELDEDDTFIRVPMSFCRFTGYSLHELMEMKIYDLLPLEELNMFIESYNQLVSHGYIENMVFYLQCANKTRKCVSITGKLGRANDTTKYIYFEKSEAVEEGIIDIQGSMGAYSTLFHEGPLATIVWRKDFEIIDWNQEAEKTFGWSRKEAIGFNLVKLMIDKALFPDYMNVLHQVLTETSYDFINYNVNKSGESIICRWVNRAIKDRAGNPQYYISIVKDITKELLKNDQLKQLSYAVEKTGCAVVVTDSDGIIQSANVHFSKMNGYLLEEMIGNNVNMINSRELPKSVYEDVWKTIKNGDTWNGEFRNIRKDGSLYWCKSTIVPVFNEWRNTVTYLGIQKDMTAERELEERSYEMYFTMIEHEKLATIGTMVAGITHEAYNYLAYIESNLTYAKKFTDKAITGSPIDLHELQSAIHDTIGGVDKIKTMLQSIKTVSRKEELPQIETCDINKEITMLVQLLKNEYKYNALMELPQEVELIHKGYPGLLRQVIMNLVINASHAIKARNTGVLGKISITTCKKDGCIQISIKDTGVGMTDDIKARIFEPFFTTKKANEGTGLGLSISKNIIEEKYGGTLTCDSTLGVGSTFVIEVPDLE